MANIPHLHPSKICLQDTPQNAFASSRTATGAHQRRRFGRPCGHACSLLNGLLVICLLATCSTSPPLLCARNSARYLTFRFFIIAHYVANYDRRFASRAEHRSRCVQPCTVYGVVSSSSTCPPRANALYRSSTTVTNVLQLSERRMAWYIVHSGIPVE